MTKDVTESNMEPWETEVFGYNLMHVKDSNIYVLVVTGNKADSIKNSCKCSFWVRLSVQPTPAGIFQILSFPRLCSNNAPVGV